MTNYADPLIDHIEKMLRLLGEDPSRGGLQETPTRAAKAWRAWLQGYYENPKHVLKCFEDGADGCNQLVIVRDIPVYSHCEHHMAPFFGVAHVGYIPNKRIVGLSKLSRLVDIFARRFQVQERLTNQIADALHDHLEPLGVGVMVECRHMCMESRGIRRAGTSTVTQALRGVIKDEADARQEFIDLAQGRRAGR